jgi:hypothetical protein
MLRDFFGHAAMTIARFESIFQAAYVLADKSSGMAGYVARKPALNDMFGSDVTLATFLGEPRLTDDGAPMQTFEMPLSFLLSNEPPSFFAKNALHLCRGFMSNEEFAAPNGIERFLARNEPLASAIATAVGFIIFLHCIETSEHARMTGTSIVLAANKMITLEEETTCVPCSCAETTLDLFQNS